jgi:isocitrate/isopropylmalate dehydrogenase
MKVVLLPGDGIGPEVVGQAAHVLEAMVPDVQLSEHAIGGHATQLGDEILAEPAKTEEASHVSA